MAEKSQTKSEVQSDQEDVETPEFNEKQLKLINSIFTSRGKTLEEKLDKRHAEMMEALKGLSVKAPEKEGKSKKDSDEMDPEVLKRIEKSEKQNAELMKKLADKEAKEKALTRKQAIHDVLTANGVPANKVKFAQVYLENSGLIDHESDEVQFVDENTNIDLKSGLKKWLKTDDGREFLPPKGIQGSGDQTRKVNGSLSKSESSFEDKLAEAVGFSS